MSDYLLALSFAALPALGNFAGGLVAASRMFRSGC